MKFRNYIKHTMNADEAAAQGIYEEALPIVIVHSNEGRDCTTCARNDGKMCSSTYGPENNDPCWAYKAK